MKDFRASEQIFLCDECGEEMKVLNSVYVERLDENIKDAVKYWDLDLECRNCGPQGKDRIYDTEPEV